MAETSGARVKTFSIGFNEPAFDELEHARRVAQHFGTDHHEFVVEPDGVGILDQLVSHFDEPFADSSAIPTWYVSEMARRHVTVVLSGDGGDELFGGYDRYLPHPRVVAFDRYSPPGAPARRGDRRLDAAARRARQELPAACRPRRSRPLPRRDPVLRRRRKAGAPDAGRPPAHARAGTPERQLARHFERFAQLPWARQMMRFDAETYLPEDVLTKVDRMSMAHSIESRVPLLDNEVVELRLHAARRRSRSRTAGASTCSRRWRPRCCRAISRSPQAGLRRAARRLVPRQPARAVFRHSAVGRLAFSAAISSRHSSASSSTSMSPASATTRCGCGSWWCSNSGISSMSTEPAGK